MRIQRVGLPALVALGLLLTVAAPGHAFSDDATRDLDAFGHTIQPMSQDKAIADAIRQVSPERIQHTIETLVSFHNRSTIGSMEKDLPPGQGVTAAADWIYSELQRTSAECGGCLEVKRDDFTEPPQTGPHPRIVQPTRIQNIYAVLRGTDPAQAKRMILVTGHYDSRVTDVMNTHDFAPGANDDASGVAVSLECARVLSKLKLPATLVFAAVAGEEQGLNGSKHLAALAKQEGWELEGVLNNDIVGGDITPGDKYQDEHAVRIFSEGIPASATPEEVRRIVMLGYDSDSPSRELARSVAEIAASYAQPSAGRLLRSSRRRITPAPDPMLLQPVLEFRLDRFLRGGDHYSFNQQGFPAIRFTEWRENFNHQHQDVRTENGVEYGDLLKFVNLHYVARVARLNATTMAVLAAAPPPPVNVRVVTHNLDNDTTLLWNGGAGAPADTRYEIVWRELSAPEWQRAIEAEHAGLLPDGKFALGPEGEYSATLPISKDNAIFGVEAVDPAGHRSPAVVPTPVR